MKVVDDEEIFLTDRFRYPQQPIIDLDEVQQIARNEINKRIANKTFKFGVVNCRCDSDSDLLLATSDRYGFWVRTVICKNCGLIRTDPQLDQESLVQFYEDLYRKPYSGNMILQDVFQNQVSKGHRILEFISSNERQNSVSSKILFEIGSGAGGILFPFKIHQYQRPSHKMDSV